MKRKLRHPIRSITEPYGRAGLLVAILALVLATTGAAFAATKLNGTQKKEVAKIAKAEAAKYANSNPGAPGPAGPAGANGKDGTNGTNGTNGVNGTSATTETFSGSGHGCTAGGIVVKSASPEVGVCNGKNGTTGFTKTLPSKETETGTWSFSVQNAEPSVYFVPISFNIPLEAELDAAHVHYVAKETSGGTACPGTVEAPQAAPGNLCVYETALTGAFGSFQAGAPGEGIRTPGLTAEGAGTAGAVMWFGELQTGKFDSGSWAVTAE